MFKFVCVLSMLLLSWLFSPSPVLAASKAIPKPVTIEGLPGQFLRLDQPSDENIKALGPLKHLPGTWVGEGWNLIAVPTNVNGQERFSLEVHPYVETLTFTPIGAKVPNKGFPTETFVKGVLYEQKVSDANTYQPLHVENGFWLLTPEQPENGGFSIARLSSIPHGNAVLAVGNDFKFSGPPEIEDLNAFPIFANPDQVPLGYNDQYLEQGTSNPAFNATNANLPLQKRLEEQAKADQVVKKTTTLLVSTDNATGGVLNIPFITDNADVSHLDSVFWIEKIKDKASDTKFLQLQYSQQTNLDFIQDFTAKNPDKLIVWPHIDVATLVKQ